MDWTLPTRSLSLACFCRMLTRFFSSSVSTWKQKVQSYSHLNCSLSLMNYTALLFNLGAVSLPSCCGPCPAVGLCPAELPLDPVWAKPSHALASMSISIVGASTSTLCVSTSCSATFFLRDPVVLSAYQNLTRDGSYRSFLPICAQFALNTDWV
jgi:hypothetical protein